MKTDYEFLEAIGKGSYANVFSAVIIKTGENVAIKQLFVSNNIEKQKEILREAMIMKECSNHNNIIRFIDVFSSHSSFSIVMELAPWNLRDIICDINKPMNDNFVRTIFQQIIYGLQYLHEEKSVIHCDIKPENILIKTSSKEGMSELTVKIADFGQASLSNKHMRNNNVGTRWYRSPELLLGSQNYDSSIDLWSFGSILAEYYTGLPIFNGITDLEQIYLIINILGLPDTNEYKEWNLLPDVKKLSFFENNEVSHLEEHISCAPPQVIEILKSLLQINPNKRKTTTELLKNPFFAWPLNYFKIHYKFKKVIAPKLVHNNFIFTNSK
uniref:Protein kinase domain-containing protein n=1 Tax=Rhabditophanes sp. KR3021 TaxID=114890 RepID=A0AC35TYI2_9BILA